jgi:membrane protease YdiL (CAAX protease family)
VFRVLFNIQALVLLVGVVGMAVGGYPPVREPDPLRDTLAFLALYLGLMGLERLFSRLFPSSFGVVQQLHSQIGRAFRDQQLGYNHALQLGMISGLAEEVFFRGALQSLLVSTLGLGWLGVVIQALIFAAFHPVPDRRAWSYPLFIFIAGLAFGVVYFLTGSLIPGILAHYLNNARGFYQLLDEAKRLERSENG